ncbi:MAG TPA: DUF445 domain-containing protein [Micropepsaceae bacterium]|nr:DUF445 domain-containing protein [Micropepsaceae bacterium]
MISSDFAGLEKRRALLRQRRLATGLLLVAMIIFIAMQFLPRAFGVRLVTSAAEAALVGGFADWFAVTALFRRPLGLPIPHTALVRTQKDRIGRALGSFVRDRFLDPELVLQRLRAHNRALQLASWLASESAGEFISGRVVALLPVVLKSADDEAVLRFFADLAREGMRRLDVAPLANAAVTRLVESGRHMEVVDALSRLAEPALDGMQDTIIEKVGGQTGRFFPLYFDRKIGKAIVRGVHGWLEEIRNPNSAERAELDGWIRRLLEEFGSSENCAQLLEEARMAIAGNPALHQVLAGVWGELKREIAADLVRPQPQSAIVTARIIRTAGELLKENRQLQDYVNAALERLIVDYIAPWRDQISDFIADVVAGWDAKTVSDLVELEVGRELQFVRINGTVIGALIGTALFLLSSFFPGF